MADPTTPSRNGPLLRVVGSCEGCRWLRERPKVSFAGNMSYVFHCAEPSQLRVHPLGVTPRKIGRKPVIPDWCPRLDDARAALGRELAAEAERIEEEAREVVRAQRLDAARKKAAERPALLAAFDADPANMHLLGKGCHADRDGDCYWASCPQARDGESKKTGRHCPLDRGEDEE